MPPEVTDRLRDTEAVTFSRYRIHGTEKLPNVLQCHWQWVLTLYQPCSSVVLLFGVFLNENIRGKNK